jgi:hypothetical protein
MSGPFGGGGIPYGKMRSVGAAPVMRGFEIAHNTVGLHSGVEIFTPNAGDLLLDAWFEIDTAWNGTTPRADFGTSTSSYGLFGNVFAPIDMTQPDFDLLGDGVVFNSSNMPLSQQIALINVSSSVELNALPPTQRPLVYTPPAGSSASGFGIFRFSAAEPISVWVTQNGQNNSPDPGATQGKATLYLITATPVRS